MANVAFGLNADMLHQAHQGSRVANLTEPCSKHWTLSQNVGSAHNPRQPPVFLMANVRPQDDFHLGIRILNLERNAEAMPTLIRSPVKCGSADGICQIV